MMLIADSGGSGTTWCLLRGEDPVFVRSEGLHPDVVDAATAIPGELDDVAPEITYVYFYGTGCAKTGKAKIIYKLLNGWFPEAEIAVYSDLVAIAHASQGTKPGLVGIIGTGASMAWFNGENIEFVAVSKGKYCDPGGGARIGKITHNLYQKNQLPADLAETIKLSIGNKSEITDNQFTNFVMQNLEHPFFATLFENEMKGYFEYYMPTWKKHRSSLVLGGTVSELGSEIIKRVAESYDITIDQIIKDPIYPLANVYISSSKSSSI